MPDQLVYLFAVCASEFALPQAFAGLSLRAHEGLHALIRLVPEAEFGTAAIEQNTQNMEWLATQATLHQAVIAEAMAASTVLPCKFATLFADLASLDQSLADQAPLFREKLAHLAGKAEYGVKIYLPTGAAAQLVNPAEWPELAALDAELAQATPGKAFLLGRKRAQLVAQHLHAAVGQWADACYQALAARATEARANPVLSRRASGREADSGRTGKRSWRKRRRGGSFGALGGLSF
jgi:Gas vesicle synthesis protein GvpL/GvpF